MNDFPTHVTIQGRSYKLKPFSAPNEKVFNEQGNEASKALEAGEIQRWEYYDRVLRLILDGPFHFDCKSPDFDAREAEAAIWSFVPPSLRAYVLLAGFQPF